MRLYISTCSAGQSPHGIADSKFIADSVGVPISLKDPHITRVSRPPGPYNTRDFGTLRPHIARVMRTGDPHLGGSPYPAYTGWSNDKTKARPSWGFEGLARFKANYIDAIASKLLQYNNYYDHPNFSIFKLMSVLTTLC